VERFYNGNPSNDPRRENIVGATDDVIPEDWKVIDWDSNWFKNPKWAENAQIPFRNAVQLRRYGGDLDGVRMKIPYMKDLGINAIYFNPLNDAPSLHKFDASYYHHIDRNFGNDVEGDRWLLENEVHSDPSKWIWTNADLLFLDLIEELDRNEIKVIVDFSFNHTGKSFWAFKDILEKKEKSEYLDWYEINSISEEGIDYTGWFGIKHLPELRKIQLTPKVDGHPYEGDLAPAVKDHIFAVCDRWINPTVQGVKRKGIDGMRLDVAEHIPLGFWRDFRKHVRALNPEFYLVGENWWTSYPDVLMDPSPWVAGDVFDAVMHYHWYKPTRALYIQSEDHTDSGNYIDKIKSVFQQYRTSTAQAMMNVNASHDSPRFWTSISNTTKYKFQCKPSDNPNYYIGPPYEGALNAGKLLLLQQFTFVGAPHIWNGDEMGMWGPDDPDNRKPLWWPEYDMENETASIYSSYQLDAKPFFNKDIFEYYKSLIALRKSSSAFSSSNLEFIEEYLFQNILAFRRWNEEEEFIILINVDSDPKTITRNTALESQKKVFTVGNTELDGSIISFDGKSGMVMKIKKMDDV
jgi:glycosidase